MKKKWNWIDTTIVIILLLVIVFLNRDKLIKTDNKALNTNERDVVITVESDRVTEDMVTDLKKGDQIFSQNELQDGFVEEVKVEPLLKTKGGSDGKLKTYEDAERVKVTVKLKGKVTFDGPYMDLGGQEIKVGIPFIMKTTKVEFNSKIKHIEVK